jgi:two-component system nitrate/nitrite sensor histidine kinase NarX
MKFAMPRLLVRHSILLLVALAMLALALISLAGMSASVMVAESVQGSASAINHAGSLRRLTYRVAGLVAADALSGPLSPRRVEAAIEDFERALEHPELQRIVQRNPGGLFAATYRGVESSWAQNLRPSLKLMARAQPSTPPEDVEALLTNVDRFVDQLDTLVFVLEQDTEARIEDLREILAGAIIATLVVIIVALFILRRSLLKPLGGLLAATRAIARGDYSARVAHVGHDELGRVGATFNLMAGEISRQYQTLEQRVAEKTAELQRSNRSLELLYHAIARLYQTPTEPAVYEATLRDIDHVAGLQGSFACIEPRQEGPATVIASTLGPCAERVARGADACSECRAVSEAGVVVSGEQKLLRFPLRDREHHYGMLRLALPAGEALEDWQRQLVEALSRHIGMALGAARRSEQERLLALQEERSVIARELHDSLAQALSYMKIQMSLLQRALADPARLAEADTILADLRTGVNDAYRQLRELLVSFRLELSGDLGALLRTAVAEYRERGGVDIALEIRLSDCSLTPNQEVHVLQIVREALSNMLRHAMARHARVALACDEGGRVTITVEDDGVGIDDGPVDGRDHHGLSIMRERARSLGGEIEITRRGEGGTRISVNFQAVHTLPALAVDAFAEEGSR